jgi:2-phosphoglycerate kinase
MKLHLQALFSQAYILGGSPCSGKSSIAEKLTALYGFHYYKVDDHDQEHLQRCQPDKQPVMFKYSRLSWNEIWSQPVLQLLADELTFARERFQFILEDLGRLGLEKPLLLEGAAILPELIEPYPLKHQNAVFMVPTPEFQIRHYKQRPWIAQILNGCQDPARAFENWMERDTLFGQEVIRQAKAHEFATISVDGTISLDEQFEQISARFGLRGYPKNTNPY